MTKKISRPKLFRTAFIFFFLTRIIHAKTKCYRLVIKGDNKLSIDYLSALKIAWMRDSQRETMRGTLPNQVRDKLI